MGAEGERALRPPLPAAALTAPAHRDLDDLQGRALEPAPLRDHLEAEAQRLRHHREPAPHLDADASHAGLPGPLDDQLVEVLRQGELMHRMEVDPRDHPRKDSGRSFRWKFETSWARLRRGGALHRFADMPNANEPRADLSICADCTKELLDAADRRYRFPFVQCADCGPSFALGPEEEPRLPACDACRVEYETPESRRFAFTRISCPACGPKLRLVTSEGEVEGEAALEGAIALVTEGGVLVAKASGGFHLAVDAQNEEAVARLRKRKQRPHKPFAVMARDLEWIERVAYLGAEEKAMIDRPERPILLLPRRGEGVAESIAPGLADLGLFLPSSALQILLLQEGPPLQVMTSANLTREPTARDDAEALDMLEGLADAVLLFERPIRNHSDDSVFRTSARGPIPIRRSRGLVPREIPLPFDAPAVLAVGGQEKNTVCLAVGRRALLSQHIGDLESAGAWSRFLEDIEALRARAGVAIQAVAHDLHPDYRSTRFALSSGLPRIPVQHHHAHIGALCVEHGVGEEALVAAIFDGTGLGDDGALWGGEFFLGGLGGYRRFGHLRPLALPGGAAAIENPWRLALSALVDAEVSLDVLGAIEDRAFPLLRDRLVRDDPFPRSSGAGRWFDAASAILGIRRHASYDGQAPAELESVANGAPADPYPFEIQQSDPFQIDLRPTIRALAAAAVEGRMGEASSRFHETMARVVEAGCERVRAATGASTVALGGGCFQNRLFLQRASSRLASAGFRVLTAKEVPQNDGGLALGQAAIAAKALLRAQQARGR